MAIDDEDKKVSQLVNNLVNNKSFVDAVMGEGFSEGLESSEKEKRSLEVKKKLNIDRDNIVGGEILERAEMSLALGNTLINLRMAIMESDVFDELKNAEEAFDMDRYVMLEDVIFKMDNEINEIGGDYNYDIKAAEGVVSKGSLEDKEEFLSINRQSNENLVDAFKAQVVEFYTDVSVFISNDKEVDAAFSRAIEEISDLKTSLEGDLVDDSGKQVRGIKPRTSYFDNPNDKGGERMH